ncbi:2-iminobutanoate/2-iminopropanoate deaminase [Globodera pallida]|nr:2-iminobutanoate/2-iminopropanoate deaminase [Globodera pallida]
MSSFSEVKKKRYPAIGFSDGALCDKTFGTLYVSGQLGIAPGESKVSGGVLAETKQAFSNLGEILKAAGASFSNVMKVTFLLVDDTDFGIVWEAACGFITGTNPARIIIRVRGLPKNGRVMVKALASIPIRSVRYIKTLSAPSGINYSQAVLGDKTLGTLYVSGQIGIAPGKSKLVSGGAGAEAKQAFSNLGEILKAAGSSFVNIVELIIVLVDFDDFLAIRDVYNGFFTGIARPARSVIRISCLPQNGRVMIEATANSSISNVCRIQTPTAPAGTDYSQAVLVDKMLSTLHISGQDGTVTESYPFDVAPGGARAEAKQAFSNLGEVLKAAGASFGNVVKVTLLLADFDDFHPVCEVYNEFFGTSRPARSVMQISGNLPDTRNVRIRIDSIAEVPIKNSGKNVRG